MDYTPAFLANPTLLLLAGLSSSTTGWAFSSSGSRLRFTDVPLPLLGPTTLSLACGTAAGAGAGGEDFTGEGYATSAAVPTSNWGMSTGADDCWTGLWGADPDNVPPPPPGVTATVTDAGRNDGSHGGSIPSRVCGGASRSPNSGTHAISKWLLW